jgi:sugar (pentulose or hexulose) kinase
MACCYASTARASSIAGPSTTSSSATASGSPNALVRVGEPLDYPQMNELAAQAPVGSDGLVILPYGNGAERTLENRNIGASVHGWNFNIHKRAHVLRAAQEGIVFAPNYALQIMRDRGTKLKTGKAGNTNMFLSPLFAEAFALVSGANAAMYAVRASDKGPPAAPAATPPSLAWDRSTSNLWPRSPRPCGTQELILDCQADTSPPG